MQKCWRFFEGNDRKELDLTIHACPLSSKCYIDDRGPNFPVAQRNGKIESNKCKPSVEFQTPKYAKHEHTSTESDNNGQTPFSQPNAFLHYLLPLV